MNLQGQQQKNIGFFRKATRQERIISAYIFFIAAGICVFLILGSTGQINLERVFSPCGFKMKYNLPCPACGITTSMLAFFRGQIAKSIITQPAGAILCIILLISVLLAFISAFLGVFFSHIDKLFTKIRLRYIIIIIIAVFVISWIITLARTITAGI
jgi:hypothetical protein